MRFAIAIERSENGFAAYVPDLPGCVAAANTEEEVRMLIRDAIEFHVEGMRESGEIVPEPTTQVEYVEVAVEM